MRFRVRADLVALLLAGFLPFAAVASEDSTGTLVVRVRNGAAPVPSAEVSTDGLRARTDARGEVSLVLPAGEHDITIGRPGFAQATLQITVGDGAENTVTVQLQQVRLETEVAVVSATRSGRLVQDQPIRVEAVPQEEIEENLTIAPGNLTTLSRTCARPGSTLCCYRRGLPTGDGRPMSGPRSREGSSTPESGSSSR